MSIGIEIADFDSFGPQTGQKFDVWSVSQFRDRCQQEFAKFDLGALRLQRDLSLIRSRQYPPGRAPPWVIESPKKAITSPFASGEPLAANASIPAQRLSARQQTALILLLSGIRSHWHNLGDSSLRSNLRRSGSQTRNFKDLFVTEYLPLNKMGMIQFNFAHTPTLDRCKSDF